MTPAAALDLQSSLVSIPLTLFSQEMATGAAAAAITLSTVGAAHAYQAPAPALFAKACAACHIAGGYVPQKIVRNQIAVIQEEDWKGKWNGQAKGRPKISNTARDSVIHSSPPTP